MDKKYSLRITISSLFLAITLALAAILSWQSFSRTSDIMLDSARKFYQQKTRELSLDFTASVSSITSSLRQFRLSPVSRAETFEQRIAQLPGFQAALASSPSIFAVGVGYQDGDYLGASRADSDYVQQKFQVPAAAAYVVFYSKKQAGEEAFQPGRQYTIFLDREGNETGTRLVSDTDFDPRSRPWYQQAREEPGATRPYVFYESKIVGLTAMSQTPVPGVVVVFDITLDYLSESIDQYRLTPNSEAVLIDDEGQVFAYADDARMMTTTVMPAGDHDVQLAGLKQLHSPVLSYVDSFIQAREQSLDFDFQGQRWIGSTRVVARPGGTDLYALMLSPVDELLVDAIAIRNRLIVAALLVLLIFIPIIWYTAARISASLHSLSREAAEIARFNFANTDSRLSSIKEVYELDTAMAQMKSTINQFIRLINSLAGEKNLETLLQRITRETLSISKSDAALIYLLDEQDDRLKAHYLYDRDEKQLAVTGLSSLSLSDIDDFFDDASGVSHSSRIVRLTQGTTNKLTPLLRLLDAPALSVVVVPLQNRNDETIGLLAYIDRSNVTVVDANTMAFLEALSGFAAVTLESRQLLNMQEALLQAFIKLIAGAIDAKSPYTAGHCQRVPEITLMLARAACASEDERFSDFDLDDEQWQELSIACWLHDCGKVTTPEYVVDKATKLETIYDRIHEVRTRFEVLKRDAAIDCWQQIADGGDRQALLAELEAQHRQLDEDFAFIAECNIGGEFMADDKLERLQAIAERTWQRTIDDRQGLSWEELERKSTAAETLPVTEKLLADKAEHLIARRESERMPEDNPWGFKVDTPEYKYNRGELYNLSVRRGTLNDEERYIINGHMIQTIIMLEKLPYPKTLRGVPLIAGSHHETMDGKGYPKRLVMSEQPLTARMMVIADIFEALTASDRPYKKAKTLSESLRILSFMRDDKHIDAELFELFLRSGVYLDYAKKSLSAEQIDEVDIDAFMS